MARAAKKTPARPSWGERLKRWLRRGCLGVLAVFALMLAAYAVVPVPWTPYQITEARRLGGIDQGMGGAGQC